MTKDYIKLSRTHSEKFINGRKVSNEEYYKVFKDVIHYKIFMSNDYISKHNGIVSNYILKVIK